MARGPDGQVPELEGGGWPFSERPLPWQIEQPGTPFAQPKLRKR